MVIRSVLAVAAVAALAAVPLATAKETSPARGPANGVVVTPSAIGGVSVGDALADARRVWGAPDATLNHRGRVSYRWRNSDGMLAYVRARGGRIEAIEVEGPVFRTRRGDGYGTSLGLFLRHWPDAKRYRSCCSDAVTHYAVAGRRGGTLLVFSFWKGVGLRAAALTTVAYFRACYVSQCD